MKQNVIREVLGKLPRERPGIRWENIKICCKERRKNDVDCCKMVADREKMLLVNNLSDPVPRGMADWKVVRLPFNISAMPTATITDSDQDGLNHPKSNSLAE